MRINGQELGEILKNLPTNSALYNNKVRFLRALATAEGVVKQITEELLYAYAAKNMHKPDSRRELTELLRYQQQLAAERV